MPEADTTKVKLRTGGVELEYEGSESFLRSDLPKFVETILSLRNPIIGGAANKLKEANREFTLTLGTMSDIIDSTKSGLNSLSEMGEMESLRLQMAMDRLSKLTAALSNILKNMAETSDEIIKNIK